MIRLHTTFKLSIGIPIIIGTALSAHAGDLDRLFNRLQGGGCVTLKEVRDNGETVTLTPDQFQFVRAFWMLVPPVTTKLPPGDHAFIAKDDKGLTAVGLYTDSDGSVCATLPAPDWMQKVIDQIGRGENGEPAGNPT